MPQDHAAHGNAHKHTEPAINAWHAYIKARSHRWSARSLLEHERLCTAGGKPKARGRRPGQASTTQPGPLYDLLQLPLSEIDAEAVERWLIQQRHRPAVARAGFVRLRAFINWCTGRPAYENQIVPAACTKPYVKDEVPGARVRQDALERQHLRSWFEHVRNLKNPVQAAYLQTVLLTGARREEIAALRWANVDFTWQRMTIADKVAGTRVIPLTPYVAALLNQLRRRPETHPDDPWVFSSPTAASGRIQEPRAAHDKVLRQAGIPHVSIHGLRRSFGSLAQWLEIPAGVIPQIQGHKPSATAERHYRVRPVDLLYMWHAKYEKWILEQAGIEQLPNAIKDMLTEHSRGSPPTS
ncbi:tyrosine-type recombinase/integrase [Pusillimonas sp. MFBS29]|uniref:tyrosine-type recombinase/integrase n=1 Tax=Pusillimonas sp. MFBS29 TaxID=2886690 RepID=UPI001D12FB41|nr:tyrosine-type recombinase/integrase [Pusillimonas sp. MFBS29]MCC2595227.1 tyrosine-type recombinase/integrase [Pusillimonas sp. MFBS29]